MVLMFNTRRVLLTTMYLLQKSFKKNSSATYTYQTLHHEMTISKVRFKQWTRRLHMQCPKAISKRSQNYLQDVRSLERNRSAAKTIPGGELLRSNIYRALTGRVSELEILAKSLRYTRRNNRCMKSSFPYSKRKKSQTYRDGKSNTARPTTLHPSGKLNNYLNPQHHVNY